MKDIQNEAEYTYSNNGIGYNYHGSKKKLEEMKSKDKKGYNKIYNNIGLVPNLGVGSKGKASSTTQSAISDGILTVDGKKLDTKTINTNTENTLHQLDKIFDKKKIEERQELARLFAKNAFEEVHRLSDKYHWKEGGPEKIALHAAIGEITAQLAGNSNGSGAIASGINELAIRKISEKYHLEDSSSRQIFSAVLGAGVNGIIKEAPNTGGSLASKGTKWNFDSVDFHGMSEDDKEISVRYTDSAKPAIAYKVAVAKLSHRNTKTPYGSEADGIAVVDSVTPFPYIRGLNAVSINHGYVKDKSGRYYEQKGLAIGVGGLPYAYTESYTNIRNNTSGDVNLSGPSVGTSVGALASVSGDIGLDGTVTTSIGTSTSGGADIHFTDVKLLKPMEVVDYNEARAGLVEIPEARNDIKPISQSISEGISDINNYQPTYEPNNNEEETIDNTDDPNDEDTGVVYNEEQSFVGTLSNVASNVSNYQPTYNPNNDEEATNDNTDDPMMRIQV